jgi:hypothetical protein
MEGLQKMGTDVGKTAESLEYHQQNQNCELEDTMVLPTDNASKVLPRVSVLDDMTLQEDAQAARASIFNSQCEPGCEHNHQSLDLLAAAAVADKFQAVANGFSNKRKLSTRDEENKVRLPKKKKCDRKSIQQKKCQQNQEIDDCIKQIAFHTGNFCRKHESPESTEYFVQLLSEFVSSSGEVPLRSSKPRDLTTFRAMNYFLSVLMGEIQVCKDVVAVLNPDFVRDTANNLARLIRKEVNHRVQLETRTASTNQSSHLAALQLEFDNVKRLMRVEMQQRNKFYAISKEQKMLIAQLSESAIENLVRQAEQRYEIQLLEKKIARQQEEHYSRLQSEFVAMLKARKSNAELLRRLRARKTEIMKTMWKKESVIQLLKNELEELSMYEQTLSNEIVNHSSGLHLHNQDEVQLLSNEIETLKEEMESLYRHQKVLINYKKASARIIMTVCRNNESSSTTEEDAQSDWGGT